MIHYCEEQKADVLLIGGDLFHRQPLLRDLKEVNSLFSRLSHTKVVLVAGNHDYIKPDSYYTTFQWAENVRFLKKKELSAAEFPELELCVYGSSYYSREIKEPFPGNTLTEEEKHLLYGRRRQKYEILMLHGGDEKHVPIQKSSLSKLRFDYIAMGHIHKPGMLEQNRICYSGSLEPTDINDIGKHGFLEVIWKEEKEEENRSVWHEAKAGSFQLLLPQVRFIPFAKREYIHTTVPVQKEMSGFDVQQAIEKVIEQRGPENLYSIRLEGFRSPDVQFDSQMMDPYGNLVRLEDETSPAYDFEKLIQEHHGNLIGRYIESFFGQDERGPMAGSIEYMALYEGVQALLKSE